MPLLILGFFALQLDRGNMYVFSLLHLLFMSNVNNVLVEML
jgi:hypothetical protein